MKRNDALTFLTMNTRLDRSLLIEFIKDPSICRWGIKKEDAIKILLGMNAYMVYIDENYKMYYKEFCEYNSLDRYVEEVTVKNIINFIINSAKSYIKILLKDDYKTCNSSVIMIDTIVSKLLDGNYYCPSKFIVSCIDNMAFMFYDTMVEYINVGTFVSFNNKVMKKSTEPIIPVEYFVGSANSKLNLDEVTTNIIIDMTVGLGVNNLSEYYLNSALSNKQIDNTCTNIILNIFDADKVDKAIIGFDVIANDTKLSQEFLITYFLGVILIRVYEVLSNTDMLNGVFDMSDLNREIINKFKHPLMNMYNYDTDLFRMICVKGDAEGNKAISDMGTITSKFKDIKFGVEDVLCNPKDEDMYIRACYKDTVINVEKCVENTKEFM